MQTLSDLGNRTLGIPAVNSEYWVAGDNIEGAVCGRRCRTDRYTRYILKSGGLVG